jgi:hypothetical protein
MLSSTEMKICDNFRVGKSVKWYGKKERDSLYFTLFLLWLKRYLVLTLTETSSGYDYAFTLNEPKYIRSLLI